MRPSKNMCRKFVLFIFWAIGICALAVEMTAANAQAACQTDDEIACQNDNTNSNHNDGDVVDNGGDAGGNAQQEPPIPPPYVPHPDPYIDKMRRAAHRRTFKMTEADDPESFNPRPSMKEIERIVQMVDGDLDAKFEYTFFQDQQHKLQKLVDYVEQRYNQIEEKTIYQKNEYQINLRNGKFVIDLFGKEYIQQLVQYFRSFTFVPIERVFFQRFEHSGTRVSPYHTDGPVISMILLLNDDYDGGEMTYLTRQHGPVVVPTKAGVVSIHGPSGAIHGNAAVNGTKHQVTFLGYPNKPIESCMFHGLLSNIDNDEL